jgi:hypothetical protein
MPARNTRRTAAMPASAMRPACSIMAISCGDLCQRTSRSTSLPSTTLHPASTRRASKRWLTARFGR